MPKRKILFVEDEEDQVFLFKTRLEANGYEFISALDGNEGLELAYKEKPDLIILDLVVPGIDGLEICRRLKKDPKMKDIPIVIATASGARDVDKECAKAGADDFTLKPYDSAKLLSKIKALLKE